MRTLFSTLLLATMTGCLAAPASASEQVSSRDAFIELVRGKTLSNRLYGTFLNVRNDGTIDGGAMGWDVTGTWVWEDGFFCRDMSWGNDPLPYNCQLVEDEGETIRFTSDKGTGDTASFVLR